MRKWGYAAMAVSAATLIVGCASTGTTRPGAPVSSSPRPAAPPGEATPVSSSPPPAAPPGGMHWLIVASAINKLDEAARPPVVARYLDGPQTTIIVGRTIPASLADWRVRFALD